MSNSSRLWDRFEDASHDNGMQMTSISNDAITALEAAEKRIAELESLTVKLPEPFKLAKSSSGLTYYYADEVDAALTAAGIKMEAE